MQNEFLAVFGDITISDILIFILALGYIIPKARQFYEWSRKYWQKTEDREKAIDNAGNLEEYHKQSVDIRTELQRQIKELQKAVDGIIERLDTKDELDRVRRMNDAKSELIRMYQFYGSKEHNPMQAWTAMEAGAFWDKFSDYEMDGGDGYVHSDVEPVMRALREIPMTNQKEVVELMQSRR